MTIYKVFRGPEWAALESAGQTRGAPVDLADGFVHFSTAAQLAETLARHFADEAGLVLVACAAEPMGDALKWEVSRGGDRFPHLYRELRLSDVLWHRAICWDGQAHVLPPGLA